MQNKMALAEEWFARGRSDLRAARRSFEARDYSTTLAVLIHQAVDKYLKGFLIRNGWKLKKTHNLAELLSEALRYEPALQTFLLFARGATVYYLDDRYPGQHPAGYPGEEMREALHDAERLIRTVEETVKSGQ